MQSLGFSELTIFCACLILISLRLRFSCIMSVAMKKKSLSERAMDVRCPTCGAGRGEKCELTSGQQRNEPHLYRRLIAGK